MSRNNCSNTKTRPSCLCLKCVGKCYVNNCDRKAVKGGMCRNGVVTECSEFKEKEDN